MSDIQQFLALMADALHNGALGEEGCADLAKALNGVPAEYHAAAFKAFLGGDDEAQQDAPDAPEDYAVIKTFDSSEFHIGDEVVGKSGIKYAVIRVNESTLDVISSDFGQRNLDKSPYLVKRTGRNFPAIAAILEEIK